MDWSGLTTLKLRWYDWIFLLVPLPFVLLDALELHSIITTGGQGYPPTSGYWCCMYIPSAADVKTSAIKFLSFAAVGYLAYVLPPRRLLRPVGRLFCFVMTGIPLLVLCLAATEAIGVTDLLP